MANRLAIKRRLGRMYRMLSQPPLRQVVLLYHSVGHGPWSLSEPEFRRQARYLSDAAVPFALHDNTVAGTDARLRVAITFDDGYASLADVAHPVLREFGLRPEVYLNTGWIGDQKRRASDTACGHYPGEMFMTWIDVQRLASEGWNIGSHGVDHLDLTSLDSDKVDTELIASKDIIEKRLSRTCPGFSYTWGRHNALVRSRVAAAGYQYACTGRHAPMDDATSPFEIPRLNIDSSYEFDDFVAVVMGDWDYLSWLQVLRH